MTACASAIDVAAALVEALVDRIVLPPPAEIHELARRRSEARSAFEELDWPAAAFESAEAGPMIVNRAWRTLLGDSGNGPPGSPVHEHVAHVVQTNEQLDLPDLAIDAGSRPIHTRAVFRPLRGGRDASSGVVVVFEVITAEAITETERMELRNRALAAEQSALRKDQFIAAVSHELRTPVTTMLLWARVLRDDANDRATREQALSAIHDAAIAQSQLVGDLLDLSRADKGKLHVDIRIVDIAAIAGQAVATMSAAAAAKGLAIELRGTDLPVYVDGDALRLRQIIDNLLSNAIKFTDAGSVTLALQHAERSVVMSVTDTGCGIAAEFLPRIFEPFSQTDDPLTRRGGGLGLGLAIAKRLVDLQRGTLAATSAGRGRGARFTLTIPAARRAQSPVRSVTGTAGLDQVRVLVIDDDHRVREALSLLLGRAGAIATTADSVRAARSELQRGTFDVIVCDVAMPDEDSYSFVANLRAHAIDLPAIAMSSHGDADADRAHAAGFDMHLAKPIDFDRLVTEIDSLVSKR